MKRLLLLTTGGTLGMTNRTASSTLAPPEKPSALLEALPEASRIAAIETRELFNLDSSNLGIAHWQRLARTIADEMDRYDGFVVIHGTDTMVYTACALSYMLSNLPKPVILTGAQRPLSEIRSDARANLISALEVATMDLPEVGLFFDHALFRGNRARKKSIHEFAAFTSPNYPALAEVGLHIRLNHDAIRRPSGLFRVHEQLSDQVVCLRVLPGMDPDPLMCLADGATQAFVLEAFGAGNVPTELNSWIPFIERATAAGKIVAIASQAPSGAVDLDLYECGAQARRAGALSCLDMTVEAAAVKLMFLLGELGSASAAARNLVVPLAGEITA